MPLLADAVLSRDLNLIAIAENPLEAGELAKTISTSTERKFSPHSGVVNQRITILAQDVIRIGGLLAESNYLVVFPFTYGETEVLLAAMHGVSRLEDELVDLNEEASVAAELLRDTENRRRHRRTILVGDLNLNPFDAGMVRARGFYGVMSKAVAAREQQRLKFKDYPLFYNPMWSRLGDDSPGPAGTFYRARTSHMSYYWNMYDQVLIRPCLLRAFESASVEILTHIGGRPLLSDGVPNNDDYSDHLPVLAALDLSKL